MPPSSEDDDILPRARNTVATNLPPVRRSPFKPSIPRRFRRPQKKRPPPSFAAATVAEDDLLFSSLTSLSDTSLALETLHAAWPIDATRVLPNTPPLVLHSQLRSLVADAALLERQLAKLVARNEWRNIILPGGDVAYVRSIELVAVVQDRGKVLRKFAEELMPAARESVVATRQLSEVFGKGAEQAENELVREGWLTMRDEGSFWFAVPGTGAFCGQREKGNAEVIGLLRKTPYKEMLLGKLEGRTMKKSCFTAQWHVRDVVGGGRAETVETSVGTLVRIREGD